MDKYLYLTKVEWADTWVNGGEIPISLASTYLSDERQGIMTPDENLIHESSIPIPSLRQYGIHIEQSKNITIGNIVHNGRHVGGIKNANFYTEDGLILSFCNSFDKSIAERMGKQACVKICNIEKLRRVIDKQLGCKGIMKECTYTRDHQRNHFLKSTDDEWQDEFRLFWGVKENRVVNLPSGLCEFVCEF